VTLDVQNTVVIGGLVSDANSVALFEYALGLASNTNPAVGFIATASGDSPAFLDKYYETFRALPCRPSHLPLFFQTPDVANYVAELDVVLVGGGNTVSMLGVWRAWNLPDILKDAWSRGTVLVGWSAGAMCWFEFGLSDSHSARPAAVPGLAFIPGSCCPHYSQDSARRDAFHRAVADGEIPAGWGVDDGAALHFKGTEPHAVLKIPGTLGATFVSHGTRGTQADELVQIELPAGTPIPATTFDPIDRS
jgi:dipeptidase E